MAFDLDSGLKIFRSGLWYRVNSRIRTFSLVAVLLLANVGGAVALVSGSASASPSGVAVSIAQCANGGVGSTPEPCVGSAGNSVTVNGGSYSNWITGNAQANNAHWAEGQFIPYRAVVSGLVAGSYMVQLQYDSLWKTYHAIDYLGSYDVTETTSPTGSTTNANNSSPCADVSTGPGGLASGACTPAKPVGQHTIPAPDLTTNPYSQCSVVAGNATPNTKPITGNMDLFGPSGSSVDNVTYDSQNQPSGSNCQTTVDVYFTVGAIGASGSTTTVVLAWGGHIASSADWGTGAAAGNISGSPYHMLLPGPFYTVTSSTDPTTTSYIKLGSQDLPLASSAVAVSSSSTATTVMNASVTPVSPESAIHIYGNGSVYDTATVTSVGSTITPSGDVVFSLYSGLCSSASPTLVSTSPNEPLTNGVATSGTQASLAPGSYFYLATYLGSSLNVGSTATCEPFTVTGVSINKSAASASIVSSSNSGSQTDSYAITPTVNGYVNAGDTVTVTDILPTYAGVTYTGISSADMNCSPTTGLVGGTVVTCTYIASSTVFEPSLGSIVVSFTVDNTTAVGTFTNTATISVGGTSANSSATVTVSRSAPTVSITKSADPTQITAPASSSSSVVTGSFTITPTVVGWVSSSVPVTVTDTLPTYTGVTYTGVTSTVMSCTPTTGLVGGTTITCTYTAPASGVFSPNLGTIMVDYSVDGTATQGVLTNTAAIAYGTLSSQDSASVAIDSPPAVVTIQKTVSQGSLTVGNLAAPVNDSYTITPVATGAVSANSTVTVKDTLPTYAGVAYTSVTSTVMSCTPTTGLVGGTTITCTYTYSGSAASISNPDLGTITVDFQVGNSTPSGSFDNTATIVYGNSFANSMATVSVTDAPGIVAISKGVTSKSLNLTTGTATDSFTLSPTMTGWTNTASPITVTDTLPDYGGYVTYSAPVVAAPASGSNIDQGTCTLTSKYDLSCTYTPGANTFLSSSTSLGDVSISFSVDGTAPTGSFFNTAYVQNGPTGSVVPSNVVQVDVAAASPVASLAKSAGFTSIDLGNVHQSRTDYYTLIPTVTGWVAGGTPFTLSDYLPDYMGYLAYSSLVTTSSGSPLSCSLDTSNDYLSCTYTTPTGSAVYSPVLGTVTVSFTISDTAPSGQFNNTASLTYGQTTVNSNRVPIDVTSAPPVFSVLKTAAQTAVSLSGTGSPVPDSYTITPTVTGWVDVGTTLTVTDPLPSYGGYVTYTGAPVVTQPGAGTLGCTIVGTSSQVLNCTYSLSSNNESTPTQVLSPSLGSVLVNFTIGANAPTGNFDNIATLGYGSTSVPSDQVQVNVTAPAPVLGIVKTVLSPSVTAGSTDTYSLALSVTGWVFHPVVISDALPQPYIADNGAPVISGTSLPAGSSYSCSVSNETVSCTFTPPAAGAYSPVLGTVTIPVAIVGDALPSVITNTASAADTGDNATTVQSSVDLTVAAGVAAPSVTPTTAAPSVTPTTAAPTLPSVAVPSTVPTGGHFGTRWFYMLLVFTGLIGVETGRRLVRRRRSA